MVSTGQKLEYLYPAGIPLADWVVVSHTPGDPGVITYWNTALGPQPTQAELDALTDQEVLDGIETNKAKEEKAAATQGVDDALDKKGNRVERIVMSVATSAIKVINNDRTTLGQMNTAVQAAASLADLKTRFAAINFPAQITMQQLVASIKADIAATPE